jgi:cell division septation protein DedD
MVPPSNKPKGKGKPKGTKGKPKPKPSKAKPDKKPAKERKPNKDAQFVLRLDRAQRDRFVEVCKDLDTSAAREIRRFIKKFIRRYEQGGFDDD